MLNLLVLLTSPFLNLSLAFKIRLQQCLSSMVWSISYYTNSQQKTHLTFTSAMWKELTPPWRARFLSGNVDFFFCGTAVRPLIYLPSPRVSVSNLAQRNDLIPEMELFHFLIFKNINKSKASWQQSSAFHNKLWGRHRILWKYWLVTLLWYARRI